MGLPPSCFYPLQAFRSGGPAALAQVMENFFRSGWDPLVLGGVDGSNAHPNLAGGGLSWSGSSGSGGGGPYPPKPNPPPHLPAPWAKRLVVELADETADARIQKKGAPGTPEKKKPGLEFVIDPTDTTYGKVCFVAKQDLTKQIGSFKIEDPATVANPKFSVLANYGKAVFGASGVGGSHGWELHYSGVASLSDVAGSSLVTPYDGMSFDGQHIQFSDARINVSDVMQYSWSSDNDTTGAGDTGLVRASAGVTKSTDGSTGHGEHAAKSVQLASDGSLKFSSTTDPVGTKDLSVERSAAGSLLLKDPSGGATSPRLQLGGTSNLFPMIVRNGAIVVMAKADYSDYAQVALRECRTTSSTQFSFAPGGDATASPDTGTGRLSAGVAKTTNGSTGFGDHALKHLLGYGAATSYRTKIDFGTPTADRTLTAPNRDLTLVGRAAAGTSNKIIRFDANGDAQDSGAEDDGTTISTARAVTITGATTTGDTRIVSVSLAYPTVDPGSGYTVTSAEGVVFVDASTLAGSDNFDVELPTASGNPNRRIAVKITSVGAGSSTITVKSAGGTVEGAAAATGVPMDATARSKVTYQSDGTNWWSV